MIFAYYGEPPTKFQDRSISAGNPAEEQNRVALSHSYGSKPDRPASYTNSCVSTSFELREGQQSNLCRLDVSVAPEQNAKLVIATPRLWVGG